MFEGENVTIDLTLNTPGILVEPHLIIRAIAQAAKASLPNAG